MMFNGELLFVEMKIVNQKAYVVQQEDLNSYCLLICEGATEGMTYEQVCELAESDLKGCCSEAGLTFFDVVNLLNKAAEGTIW